MSQKGGPRVLEMVRDIRAAPERVFRALTDPGDLMQWWGTAGDLTKAEIDLRPGGRYRLEFRMPNGETGHVTGEYRVIEPPRRIVKTWFSPTHQGLETVVEFTLEPTEDGTRLTLRHSGLDAMPGAYRDHELGWIEALGHLTGWLIAVAGLFSARRAGGTEE